MIYVYIIDDSAVVRSVLKQVLEMNTDIKVIGSSPDPVFALEKLGKSERWPDVIVLDIEMPRMDGISFLKKIMHTHPTPVLICSSLAEESSETAWVALKEGAVGIVTKPKIGLKDFLEDSAIYLGECIRSASISKLKHQILAPSPKTNGLDFTKIATTDRIVAIGTSTGGTIALEDILTSLPANSPGIVIVQHMPEKFTEAFANRLDKICKITVREAKDGDRIQEGIALIAPGNKHMEVVGSGAQFIVRITDGPLVNRHRPSVDVLFHSVAKHVGRNAKAFLLTGMGADGAAGLLEIRQAGGRTIAQDEASSVVFGMPREAIERGAAEKILSLEDVPAEILAS
ncbi:protein-glutamate methylesterase/protein-glutamine glutaminase [Leptospira andrefontaineae]|uniref:Protein-glutamate methylesterase/protein-glutamine glutaminase n=1 Tax=Leptospira andrefontaineae TaxID=2484976 RepID=A0A4R9H2W5_9LEPT|nr:chemotaxis response regulator protein-glutamate methylesterase [Leptospira andrefontaineae]TGK39058.1 chemotaxis response regulator protein-glutamate methylesterase [Leptospira andrefontaineae]